MMTEDQIRLLGSIFSGQETKAPASITEVPVIGGLSTTQQKMRDILKEREEEAERARQADYASRPLIEKARGVGEAGRFLGETVSRAIGEPFVELGGRAMGRKGLGEQYAQGARLPESELGLVYAGRAGEALEPVSKALEASKIPHMAPGMSTFPARMADDVATQLTTRPKLDLAAIPMRPMVAAKTATSQPGVKYETRQDGPFYRVTPEGIGRPTRGNKEAPGTGAAPTTGTVRDDIPQPITDAQLEEVMAQPDNFVRSVASQYAQEVNGRPYELPEMTESSITKQAPIGRTFMLAASDDPKYKSTIFEAYGSKMPEVIEQSGAKNYDQLVEAAYRQLAKETDDQFKRLPVGMSFHRAGEGNYNSSRDMLRDVYGNRHLYVFQGGDPHPFMNKVDQVTGLNDNEKFRAVHDFFGHAIHGNQFGPKGEEIAWLAHSQMYSPLARLAMTTETRGQNSVVNYTPLNAKVKERLAEIEDRIYEAKRRGETSDIAELEALKRDVYNEFQYAPQKGLLLPPEMLTPQYAGEVPGYIRGLITPESGTTRTEKLTHFSGEPGIRVTDPSRYGTGIRGEEAERLAGAPDIRPRTFFYTGEEPTPEAGLGPYRYGAQADLYDISADPLQIKTLARESLRRPMSARVNPGMVDPGEALTAAERILRDYGYTGYVAPERRAATVFSPLQVQRYANGGSAREVPSPEQFAIDQALRQQEEEQKAKKAAEMSSRPILEKGKGALEAAQTTASAIGRGLLNPFFELGGRMFGQKGLGERLTAATPMPKSELGLYYMGNVGEAAGALGRLAQEYKVPDTPFMPELLSVSTLPLMALPKASKAAEDASSAIRQEFQTAPVGAVQLQPAPVSELNFYSPAQQAVVNLKQQKGTGNQFLAQISKTPGVKPAELEWTGLADFLKSRGEQPVTKQEINNYLRNNKVQVSEKIMVSPEARTKMINDALPFNYSLLPDGMYYDDISEKFLYQHELPDEIRDDIRMITDNVSEAEYDYGEYVLPGGENYREILLTIPVKERVVETQIPAGPKPKIFENKISGDFELLDAFGEPAFVFKTKAEAEKKAEEIAAPSVKKETVRDQEFRSSHYLEPNIVAHMRVNDRVDADGNKVLFVEELQSDWSQQGRRMGFTPQGKNRYGPEFIATSKDGRQRDFYDGNIAQEWLDSQGGGELQIVPLKNTIPSAPFVSTQQYQVMKDGKPLVTKNKKDQDVSHIYDSPEDAQRAAEKFGGTVKDIGMQESTEGWVNLSLKRLITEAVNKGYDRVAFINGAQSADRYDLSKYVDTVIWEKDANGQITYTAEKDGANLATKTVSQKDLADNLGKDVAEKILSSNKNDGALTGLDLEVGGEGMKKFYDQIVPNIANKLLKKLGGGKLEEINISVGKKNFDMYDLEDATPEELAKLQAGGGFKQLGFTITPEMKNLVRQGLPLFAKGGRVLSAVEQAGKAAKKASDAKRREQRVQANLEAYMGNKDKPKTYYHATQANEDFEVFDLERRPTPKSAKAVFLTPSTDWASTWLDTDMSMLEKTGVPKPRIMPLITRAKNTFDYENPGHVTQVMNQAELPPGINREHVTDMLSEGNWNFIEDRRIQKAIRDLGFDSFNVSERGTKNLGVFDIHDVKALFNRGSYDPNEPSISKAKGGLACL